jgi:N-methylhydantoinase A
MCYGTGGTAPTVTDAHLVLGRIPPHLLGGEVPLDVDAARAGIAAIATALDLAEEATAAGVLEVSAWNQANALRQVTVKRGLDVRDFLLVAFGGSGPLLACRLVDILGLRGVLVPRDPGNLSAFGLLTVDVRNDYVRTSVSRASRLDASAVQAILDDLTGSATSALEREGFAPAERRFEITADLRYLGQAYEVRVPVPPEAFSHDVAGGVAARFHDEHRRLYGYDFREDPRQEVEWVNLRVTGVGPIRKPVLPRWAAGSGAHRGLRSTRKVYFADDWTEAAIYDRALLGSTDEVAGPAVIEEFSSTVPVYPGFTAQVDDLGNLVIRRAAA